MLDHVAYLFFSIIAHRPACLKQLLVRDERHLQFKQAEGIRLRECLFHLSILHHTPLTESGLETQDTHGGVATRS